LPFGDDLLGFRRAKQKQRQSGIGMFEHHRNRSLPFADVIGQPDRDAAIGGDRQVDGHPHAAHRAPQHHALAVQIDDAQMLVGRLVGGRETHRQ
jgi:hypothetical protein